MRLAREQVSLSQPLCSSHNGKKIAPRVVKKLGEQRATLNKSCPKQKPLDWRLCLQGFRLCRFLNLCRNGFAWQTPTRPRNHRTNTNPSPPCWQPTKKPLNQPPPPPPPPPNPPPAPTPNRPRPPEKENTPPTSKFDWQVPPRFFTLEREDPGRGPKATQK